MVTVPMGGVSGNPVMLDSLSSGSAYYTAEVLGYRVVDTSTSVFLPATPRRLGTVSIPANKSVTLPIAGKDGIPATGTTAVALDLTASESTAPGTLAAYADGTALPFLISVSYLRGIPVANASIAAVGTDGAIRLYNAGSSTVAVNVDLPARTTPTPDLGPRRRDGSRRASGCNGGANLSAPASGYHLRDDLGYGGGGA